MNDFKHEGEYSQTGGRTSLAIPAAIIIGFGLIAASIYFGGSDSNVAGQEAAVVEATKSLAEVAPVSDADHIRGNPNAKVVVVEYSDFDCPFCKTFHATMQAIMNEYGPSGNVAWVYRHFPLTSLHPSAQYIAESSECVAQIAGNDAFWDFTDMVFSERSTNEPTNVARLPDFAEAVGVSQTDFESCLNSGRGKAKVETDKNNAVAIGGTGTPYSLVIFGDEVMVINGAQPYEIVKQMIEGLLQ